MENNTKMGLDHLDASAQFPVLSGNDTGFHPAHLSSFYFHDTSGGVSPEYVGGAGMIIRKDPIVYDIGMVLARSFYQYLVSKTLVVPAHLSFSFDSSMSTLQIGAMESPTFIRFKAAIILEAARLSLLAPSARTKTLLSADVAALATSFGVEAAQLNDMVARVVSKMDTLFTDRQALHLLATANSTDIIESYSALFNMPRVTWDDCARSSAALGQIYTAILAGVDVTSVDTMMTSLISGIPALDSIMKLVTIRDYWGLPAIPMSAAALFSLTGQAGPDAELALPYIARNTEADEDGGGPAQFKFWNLEAPAFYRNFWINDVMRTLSTIDATLFGVRSGVASLEAYMTFTMNSGSYMAVPENPVDGRSLLATPAVESMLSAAAYMNALVENGSPQQAAIVTALKAQKLDSAANAILPSLYSKLSALIALADVMPQTRALFAAALDKAGAFSFLCSEADSDTNALGGIGLVPLSVITASTKSVFSLATPSVDQLVSDMQADVEEMNRPVWSPKPRKKSRNTALKALSESVISTDATPHSLLSRRVFDRWWDLYKTAFDELKVVPSSPATVRYIYDPAQLLQRPALFPLQLDAKLAVSLDPWFARRQDDQDPGVAGMEVLSLPMPYLLAGTRVFGSGNSSAALCDMHAAALFPALVPTGASHTCIPIVPAGGGLLGPIDISGVTSYFPLAALERLNRKSKSSEMARTIATLVTAWTSGYVHMNVSRLQTAMYLRSAGVLGLSGPQDLFNAWPSLYRALQIPSGGLINDVHTIELASTTFAARLSPDPVLLIPDSGLVRVERLELTGPNFSVPAPIVVMHPYNHAVLSSIDAGPLVEPPSSVASNDATAVLVENHTAYGVSSDAKAPKGDGKVHTNVGTGQLSQKNPSSTEPTTPPEALAEPEI